MTRTAEPIPVRVPGGRDYEVVVEVGSLVRVGTEAAAAVPAVHRWAVVSDDTVGSLYGERVVEAVRSTGRGCELTTFPAGERHKTRETWGLVTDRLLALGHGRDSGIVALGGGVVGDLAGFVAATFMRGIPVVQVPTSIVAMVDSAVGGKTGVDTPRGKNLVGSFHPPARVVVDPAVVETLPRELRAEGLAEAVKHGAIADAGYAEVLERDARALLAGDCERWTPVVRRSVEIKASVVGRDEKESGLREILNFGHTLGHALEAASGYGLGHGAAVAAGMVLEARLGERLGRTRSGTAARIAQVLDAVELPSSLPPGMDRDRVLAFTRADKKVRAGRARYVLLEGLGAVARVGDGWAEEVDDDRVLEVLGLP